MLDAQSLDGLHRITIALDRTNCTHWIRNKIDQLKLYPEKSMDEKTCQHGKFGANELTTFPSSIRLGYTVRAIALASRNREPLSAGGKKSCEWNQITSEGQRFSIQ